MSEAFIIHQPAEKLTAWLTATAHQRATLSSLPAQLQGLTLYTT